MYLEFGVKGMRRERMKESAGKSGKRRLLRRADVPLYIMAAPAVIVLLVFCYLPMAGLIMAFQDYNVIKGILGSELVGLKNFEFLFSTTDAFVITRNTVLYNLAFIVVNLILSVALALMLSELRSRRMAKTFQTIYMVPYFLSWAVVAILVSAFLDRANGFVNQMIRAGGGDGLINWYQRPEIWPFLLVFVNAWKGIGYQTVLYLAVISGISVEYYEAATLDGASRFQQARYITIPHLRYIISISLIMSMGSIFRGDFGLFYNVTNNSGALYPVTDVIDTYIYRGLTSMSNIGMSTAAGLYQSAVGFVLVLAANKVVTKIDPDSAMF